MAFTECKYKTEAGLEYVQARCGLGQFLLQS